MHDDEGQRFEQAKAAFLDGLAAHQAGDLARAEQLYQQSLQALPGRPSTLVNLAAVQLRLGKPEPALQHADAALAAEPGSADALQHRATALAELGRPLEALQAFDALLAQRPKDATAWMARGNLLRELQQLPAAAQAFERALALGADGQLAAYHLAAVQGAAATAPGEGASPAAVPPASPPAYVQALFDAYAADFDHHLVQGLQYRGPEQMLQLLATHGRLPAGTAIDLGCGTGLAGPLLRSQVQRLVGVDLSAGMLAQARATGAYDRLEQAEVVQFLREGGERPELLLAGDVFIYIGDLQPLFAAAAAAMPRGAFVFSVEELPPDAPDAATPGFRLLPSLRYAQSRQGLQALAAAHGFAVQAMVSAPVRHEQGRAVPGLFVLLVRG